MDVAKRGGKVSKLARDYYELQTGKDAISSNNVIGVRYDKKNIEMK